MRIKATDPEAANIVGVFVNEKRVLYPIEFDTEENWVLGLVPVLPKVKEIKTVDPDIDNPEETTEVEWIQKKFEGKVKVTIYEKLDESNL